MSLAEGIGETCSAKSESADVGVVDDLCVNERSHLLPKGVLSTSPDCNRSVQVGMLYIYTCVVVVRSRWGIGGCVL